MKIQISIILCFTAVFAFAEDGFYFGGPYLGQCGSDGYYYVDTESFVQCSGGQAYQHKCPLGTANSPLKFFKTGYFKETTIFCDMNLNDIAVPYPFYKKESGSDMDMSESGSSEESKEDDMTEYKAKDKSTDDMMDSTDGDAEKPSDMASMDEEYGLYYGPYVYYPFAPYRRDSYYYPYAYPYGQHYFEKYMAKAKEE